MSQALAAHDTLARSAVDSHQDTVVKMIGDGMLSYARLRSTLWRLSTVHVTYAKCSALLK